MSTLRWMMVSRAGDPFFFVIGVASSVGVPSSSMLAKNDSTEAQIHGVVLGLLIYIIPIYFWLHLFVVVDMIIICFSFLFLSDGLISLFN